MRICARWYATGELQDIVSRDGRFPSGGPPDPAAKPDREAGWAAPALFDLQINGCDGVSFNSPQLTTEAIRHVVHVCRRHGVAGFCPTLVTQSAEALLHGFAVAAAGVRDRTPRSPAPCRRCTWKGRTSAPRTARAAPIRVGTSARRIGTSFVAFRRRRAAASAWSRWPPNTTAPCRSSKSWPRPASSSRSATPRASGGRLRDAVRAGARLSTHLGNGCHATLPRHDNPIWEQLADDDLWASVICDGWHLTPAVARCILRVKTPARAVLTCDASSLAGLPPGVYREWDQQFEVLPGGKVVVPGTSYLAGSGVFTDACVGWAVRHAGVGLRDAVDMAGARPRELLGLPEEMSNLVLFRLRSGR